MRQRGLVRKMIAERLVMCRAKLKIRPAMNVGKMSGRVMCRKVYPVSAPRLVKASSIAGSICCSAAIPARTEAGKLRTA